MEGTLTPALALDYLRELSTDMRAGILLDGAGSRLAGSPDMAAGARTLVAACGGARAAEVRAPAGFACLTLSPGYALVVLAGPFALPELLFHDMTTVMELLAPSETGLLAGALVVSGPPAAAPASVRVRLAPLGGLLAPLHRGDPRRGPLERLGSELLATAEAAETGT
jgi:hypothetical protein